MKILYTAFCAAALFFTTSAFSQVDIFIKVTDPSGNVLPGETTATGLTNYSEVYSESGGSLNACATAGTAGCKTQTADPTFNIAFDKTLNYLRRFQYKGQPLQRVDVVFRNAGSGPSPFVFYQLRMDNVFITSISESSSDGRPSIQVAFAPTKIGWTYTPQNLTTGAAGTPVKFGWDHQTNTEWLSF